MLFKKKVKDTIDYNNVRLDTYLNSEHYNPIVYKMAKASNAQMRKLMLIDVQLEQVRLDFISNPKYVIGKKICRIEKKDGFLYEIACSVKESECAWVPDIDWYDCMHHMYNTRTACHSDVLDREKGELFEYYLTMYWGSACDGTYMYDKNDEGRDKDRVWKVGMITRTLFYLLVEEHSNKEKRDNLVADLLKFYDTVHREVWNRVEVQSKEEIDALYYRYAKDNSNKAIEEMLFGPDYRLKELLLKYVPEDVIFMEKYDNIDIEKEFDLNKF